MGNEVLLFRTYNLFYGHEPVLKEENKDNLMMEFQTMVFLLEHCGINLGLYPFSYENVGGYYMPISNALTNTVLSMLENPNINYHIDIDLKEESKKRIEILKSVLYNELNDVNLVQICSIIFTKNNILKTVENYQIAEFIRCDVGRVERVLSLKQKLNAQE